MRSLPFFALVSFSSMVLFFVTGVANEDVLPFVPQRVLLSIKFDDLDCVFFAGQSDEGGFRMDPSVPI